MTQSRHLPVRGTTVGLALGLLLGVPLAAQAGEGGGGSRQAAGGGHMSSYVSDPNHDPRSLHSQRSGTGQILGAPMLHDRAGAAVTPGRVVDPHWASGTGEPRRIRR
ncbi:hypothetical protein SAMN02799622_05123 [Methylobacterium sp. UNC378MF]|uniref:hypothetical protein n=1 Tax=Methylobacterium sp. UNC378MF TaxID=1502748 RepID=UPI0008869770|nr:hypothetical protein [Methylobacterium sp. UNC378MF]SDA31926.1 hypothetical protein SAMN02799622_05123 [Methylobacterium sp. UNC378MF]